VRRRCVSTPYALFYAQERGTLFIGAQQNVTRA
jgi:predicted membrane GTPase involved in stress response